MQLHKRHWEDEMADRETVEGIAKMEDKINEIPSWRPEVSFHEGARVHAIYMHTKLYLMVWEDAPGMGYWHCNRIRHGVSLN